MPDVEATDFLRFILRGNERVWKTLFPWVRKKENITATFGCGHPKDSGSTGGIHKPFNGSLTHSMGVGGES